MKLDLCLKDTNKIFLTPHPPTPNDCAQMLTKSWLGVITSADQMEGTGSGPAPFTSFLGVASISRIHLPEAGVLRDSALLILRVRLFYVRSVCCQETTKDSGYRTQGVPGKWNDCLPTTVICPRLPFYGSFHFYPSCGFIA